MTTMLPWNTFLVCGVEASPNGGASFYIGMTKQAPQSQLTCQICNRSSVMLPETSSARDGIDNDRPTKVGRQWHEAAVRNQTRVPHDSRVASPSIVQDPPVPLSNSRGPAQSINPFVTAEMLRTNSVAWHVPPTRPAILTSVPDIWAIVQDLDASQSQLKRRARKRPLCFAWRKMRNKLTSA
ncbi:hypothetical protein N7489_004665 [Penicillium chrysogenum]|uniref:uncharacterized protein n=1 Tax=Penicillium chrysogenum TaxID=5076 RepID=UPI0024DF2FDA|nr:uncharacterized protein N7489_004665 [Penicillium chrysogenum]KAJ5244569.1 hypothetical protein N7489_004665 [Penicillium chrysogenum]